MFNILQHLFTARALQKENADLTAQVAALKAQIDDLKAQVDVLRQENEALQKRLNEPSHNSGPLEPPWSEP
jgi:regulator of replication initiation timing